MAKLIRQILSENFGMCYGGPVPAGTANTDKP